MKNLTERNPFDERSELLDIDTGEVAAETVNVFNAKSIGDSILKKMVEKPVFEYSYQRKDMAVTMKSKSSVELDGETIPIDNQLLFQRLSIVAGRDHLELESSLHYELSSLPAALFDKDGLMRDSNKSNLADAIWKVAGSHHSVVPSEKSFVLDGGSLLAMKNVEERTNILRNL